MEGAEKSTPLVHGEESDIRNVFQGAVFVGERARAFQELVDDRHNDRVCNPLLEKLEKVISSDTSSPPLVVSGVMEQRFAELQWLCGAVTLAVAVAAVDHGQGS